MAEVVHHASQRREHSLEEVFHAARPTGCVVADRADARSVNASNEHRVFCASSLRSRCSASFCFVSRSRRSSIAARRVRNSCDVGSGDDRSGRDAAPVLGGEAVCANATGGPANKIGTCQSQPGRCNSVVCTIRAPNEGWKATTETSPNRRSRYYRHASFTSLSKSTFDSRFNGIVVSATRDRPCGRA
jgi:hypothetical protein